MLGLGAIEEGVGRPKPTVGARVSGTAYIKDCGIVGFGPRLLFLNPRLRGSFLNLMRAYGVFFNEGAPETCFLSWVLWMSCQMPCYLELCLVPILGKPPTYL